MESIEKLLHIFKSPALSAVLRWSRCVRLPMLGICTAVIVNVLCSLAETLVTRELIDSAIASQAGALWKWGIALTALMLAQRGMSILSAWLRVRTSARLQKNLQGEIISEILSKEYAGLKRYHSGELVSRVFSDVAVIRNGIIGIIPSLCSMAVSFIGAVIILASMDWRLVAALLAGGLVGSGIMLLFRKPMKERHKRMQQAESRLHASAQETLENIRLIKASLSEKQILQRVHTDQDHLETEQRRQGRFSIVMNQSMGVMFNTSWLVCMLWGCANIFRGNMTYGALAAMIQLIGRIQGPIAGAADLAAQTYGVIASAERLQELTGLPVEADGVPAKEFDSIRLSNVSFAYEDGNVDVLKDISYEIRKGDFVALTGISGGGKTSLFQLLLGIYTPTGGSVTFDTESGPLDASRRTRGLFAYVPQGNTLISGSLRENLTMFCGEASDEAIRKAAEAACIDYLLDDIGPDAMLGERGVGLSEGQAQRVSIARALLSGAPILLLDESTSALDDETEAKVLANIAAMKDKTCLIVTHRSAALAICNRRLHIAEGELMRDASK